MHACLGQLVRRLLSIDLKGLNALSEHLDLLENALQIRLERPLQDFQSGLLLQLSLFQPIEGVKAELEERAEQAFGGAGLIPRDRLLEVPQDGLFAVVVHDEKVALVEAGVQDSRHDRLVIGEELRLLPSRPCCLLVHSRLGLH